MRVVVTGGRGQLARGIVRRGTVHGIDVIALGRETLDVTNPPQIAAALAVCAPHVVIDAAGFTDVDRAETERARAYAVNAVGAYNVARACAERATPVIHVSTDHVFDGAATQPYREGDRISPVNVYGETKAAGEQAVLGVGGTVVRTAWLFGEGGPSFVHAIAHRAVSQPVLRVVTDQHGSPTWVDDLADALLELSVKKPQPEVVHVCGDEPATRHAFALAIVDELRGHAAVTCERIAPISSAELPACARRPPYSVLDTERARSRGLRIGSWRDGLRRMLAAEQRGAG